LIKIEAIDLKYLLKSRLHQADIQPNEVLDLNEKYGPVDFYHAALTIGDDYYKTQQFIRQHKRNRRGEVVLIIRNRQQRILLHTKPFYPENIYRLPTGGVKEDESVIAGLYREIREETSFNPRFIHLSAVILYTLKNRRSLLPLNSYLFEIEPDGDHPVVLDAAEEISGFEWAPISYFPRIIDKLENLQPQRWGDWGRFRAVAHRVFSRALEMRKSETSRLDVTGDMRKHAVRQ
jgi:8-oxo-dGTP pyrophosphatase MutT (NUDIX family)